jgi:hypothetical protein
VRPWTVISILACTFLAACGGGDKDKSTPTPTRTPAATPVKLAPGLPKTPPTVTATVKQQLDRCVNRWNADIGSAAPKSAHAAIRESAKENAGRQLATVTTYDGPKIALRRDTCVVVVSRGATVFAPFSRVRKHAWVALCQLVGAKRDPEQPRLCPTYTAPLAHVANARFRRDGTLRLRVSTG